ncbi:UNVERIFIED_CONTAM: Methylecgonone reductase [Sesamum latifolium]|uniref:Methylecgonone reductase n=1 Tax=Sesamum latifolium TaxID=2727402 RepID=A0AAW2UEI8_9LAMI
MDTVEIPEVVLNSGHKMPAIALGTAGTASPSTEQLTPLFVEAIAAGYRHLDTAAVYLTEEIVGQAVAEALRRGLIKRRDELFITTKLWCADADHDLVLPALKESLRKLGLQYVDLYLIHWPARLKKDDTNSIQTMHFDIKGTWEAMEECCRMGLAKSIGVSNYSCAKLSTLLENATIPPAVNQVELNVAWQQQKLIEFCKDKGIHVCAFSPLGGVYGSVNAVMESPILKDIAAARNKTVAQVALRWVREQGATPIARSFDRERMRQNLQIFDWELTDEEVAKMQQIPQLRANTGKEFVSPEGPYKSLEELWDGEI